ncbi:MAG: LamG domain-containing protein, partial [bacterium]
MFNVFNKDGSDNNKNAIDYNKIGINHVTGTFDGQSNKLYINGQLVSENNKKLVVGDRDGDSIIGRDPYGNSRYYDGKIISLQIWNKALSQEEIQKNMTKTLTGKENGLVAYYPFDESEGTTLTDKAGNNDGTINGAT